MLTYLFSSPTFLGRYTVGADGTIAVTLPAGVTGNHRIAVYALDGTLLGWDTITITRSRGALAATGATVLPVLVTGGLLLAAGLVLLGVRRRRAL